MATVAIFPASVIGIVGIFIPESISLDVSMFGIIQLNINTIGSITSIGVLAAFTTISSCMVVTI